jgi:hypothetical protein
MMWVCSVVFYDVAVYNVFLYDEGVYDVSGYLY